MSEDAKLTEMTMGELIDAGTDILADIMTMSERLDGVIQTLRARSVHAQYAWSPPKPDPVAKTMDAIPKE